MTTTTAEQAVRRVVRYMQDNLGQDLTVDDLARTALFSKFHFTRLFQEATGTSPGRFLSALRIQEAKRLLVNSDFSVADISGRVGYSSVGTFSSRFKACVGLSPRAYRELGGTSPKLPAPVTGPSSVAHSLSLRGRVLFPPGTAPGRVFVGLFPSCVRQGRPARWTVLDGPGAFVLKDAPGGTWYVLFHSVPHGHEGELFGRPARGLLSVGRHGPVTVHPDALPRPAEITLRPQDILDPPILIALLDVAGGAGGRAGP
ncbi:AraC family transcriptional regulator [Streptomyces sp. NBC_01754]|uniref:AraC family transcriptional regulator n=1 Tax=Streptomyces sp. NBC_01754 TaxID=2975930 RepID=UPI002DD8DCD9|nr:AraC family transcriptional regulator [Streptomyces sp. NBC_01754]WSC90958.1 AraC family transcriptional regulator [Streptomyces sp. NBC_01754]WSC96548.1 AraC family transcriptional regulator [Streptomyces sp. NBC_01754]